MKRRTVIVGLRLTREERAALRAVARSARMSVSAYVRSVLLLNVKPYRAEFEAAVRVHETGGRS